MHTVVYMHDTFFLYTFHVVQTFSGLNALAVFVLCALTFLPLYFSLSFFFFNPRCSLHLASIHCLMAVRLSDQLLCISI